MLHFRSYTPGTTSGNVSDLLAISGVIDDAMRPGNFLVAPELHLTWIAARAETIPWEIFRGRLVDASQTRERRSFLSWHVVESNDTHPATESTLSVKLDVHERVIHVTRGFPAYVWEGYDAGGGVFESREIVKWTRELVGTMQLGDFTDLDSVRDELICLIWSAIVGTSRLPLTSVEAPLPAYSFGQLHYVYRSEAPEVPVTLGGGIKVIDFASISRLEVVKLVEVCLRRIGMTDAFLVLEAIGASRILANFADWMRLWRDLFNNVSLSPHTCLVSNALPCMAISLLQAEGIDLEGSLLRQLGQHLTAFDLITFHHRGANYPDALLLNELLDCYFQRAEMAPELFMHSDVPARLRRRALRQAILLRRFYEGHFVPDAPTSPGENMRVMPASHPRVPDEQLTQSHKRIRRLFADNPLTSRNREGALPKILAKAVEDLEQLDERAEMGMGLFIDRPLGYAKQVGEPDLTPLLAHEAFSASIARRRWADLKELCADWNIAVDTAKLDAPFERGPWPDGLPHTVVAECPRPVAALCDVRKVANDFVILCTKPGGLRRMLDLVGWPKDAELPRLCAPSRDGAIALYDERLRRIAELRVDASQGYITRAGVELPRAGVRITRTS
ncbi:MAG TPA: hypothetical protein VFE62_01840 [Gemmataceae bacterium]|nr:hypothetical protein [Gemmataceae bacterium]